MQKQVSLVALAMATVASPSLAQEVVEGGSAEATPQADQVRSENLIIVSARRREETTQDIPLSISAFGSEEIDKFGFENAFDIAQQTPNVNISSFFDNSKPEIVIRGLGPQRLFSAFEQTPVGVYYDDIFSGSRSAHLAQMFDLERVEVLRGPQGTLFGRNTTGGAINFISKKPGDAFSLEGSVTYGRFNELSFEAAVDLPLSDTLAVRLAGIKRDRDGYVKNISGIPGVPERLQDVDNWGARAIIEWTPNASMDWTLNVHGFGSDTNTPAIFGRIGQGNGEPNTITGFVHPEDFYTLSINEVPEETIDAWGASLTGNIDIGNVTVTTITAYEDVEAFEFEDSDATPFAIQAFSVPDDHWQFSQELRFASNFGSLDWILGFYYYKDNLKANNVFNGFRDPFFGVAPGFEADNFLDQDTENWAIFGDVRLPLTDTLTVNGGLRFTSEDKSINADATVVVFSPDGMGGEIPFTIPTIVDEEVEADSNELTGRITLEWKPNDDLMIYGGYSRGFKSGGFNSQAFASPTELEPYDPETVDAFELGLKSTLFGGAATFNASIFHQKIKGLQSLVVIEDPFLGPLFFVRNAAEATSKGAEIEFRAEPMDGLTTSLGVGLVDAEFDSFPFNDGTGRDATGNKLPGVPSLSVNGLVQYEAYLAGGSSVTPRFDFSYVSDQFFEAQNRPLLDEQEGYILANASLSWRSSNERYEVRGWVKNLFDKQYFAKALGGQSVSAGNATSYHGAPRMYGVTFRFRFD